jgi:hypothetical protein
MMGRTQERTEVNDRHDAAVFAFLAGALVAVALLQLLLFLFQRQSQVNLYHAMFAGATSVAIGLAYFVPGTGMEDSTIAQISGLWFVVNLRHQSFAAVHPVSRGSDPQG